MKQKNDENNLQEVAMHVSAISIIVNVSLSLGKFIAGLLGNSAAMVSDAIHSASDVFSTFIVIIGVRISGKKSDEEHQYGHERFESVASILLAVILALTGVGIGKGGIDKIAGGNYENLAIPSILPLVAALISITVKEWMYQYTRKNAKKVNSSALMADAWHHRSDALSSIGAFVGILGARMGYPIMDPIASIVIAAFIIKAAYDIFKDSIDKLIDKACDEQTTQHIRSTILAQEGVLGIDDIKTRLFGSKIYVDVEIAADKNMTLLEAHEIAESVHDSIESEFEMVKHCMVHVNPYEKTLAE